MMLSDVTPADRPRQRRTLAALAAMGLCCGSALQGCTDLRRAVGLERTTPDEFAVESRAPLTIPPDFELRPPQPGAARPQDKSAAERARQALEKAGPGEPGKQASESSLRYSGTIGTEQTDPTQQVAPDSLSSKLLGYGQGGGAAVEKHETSTVKGVY